MHDLVELALSQFADHCSELEHSQCGGSGACVQQLEEHRVRATREHHARRFDLGRDTLGAVGEPSESWSTGALVRTVHDLTLTPPTRDWLRRSVFITSALARLGERGLPADAVVRTGLGKNLLRRIFVAAAGFWCAAREGEVDAEGVPAMLRGWVALLDGCEQLPRLAQPSPIHVVAVALAGAPGDRAREWLRRAAVAHLISWRIDGYLEVERTPDEVVLRGGKDATRWVVDRFTQTYVDEWLTPSLHWELAFNHSPGDSASRAGVPLKVLSERIVTDSMLIEALQRRIDRPEGRDTLEGGLSADEAIAAIGAMLENGQLDAAQAMARRLHEAYPAAWEFAMAYAFARIPTAPREAAVIMQQLTLEAPTAVGLRTINLACCALFQNDPDRALHTIAALDPAVADAIMPEGAWLWDVEDVIAGRATARFVLVREWLASFRVCVQAA